VAKMLTKAQKAQQAQDLIKSLVPTLPTFKYLQEEGTYLSILDKKERRAYQLRQYFKKISTRRRMLTVKTKFCWTVLCDPFPQLFEYRDDDEEFFAQFRPVKFKYFRKAHEYYVGLIKETLRVARANKTASSYAFPVKSPIDS
jgi:hypothetical protein